MSTSKYTGKYTKAFLSEHPLGTDSSDSEYLDKVINVEENEAVFIYSFKEKKMKYVKGFEKLTGIKDEEINIFQLNSIKKSTYDDFLHEFYDRVLLYLYNHNENLESISTFVIQKTGNFDTPMIVILKVFDTDENGNLVSIIGKTIIDRTLKTSNIVQYAFSGIASDTFEYEINNQLDHNLSISINNISLIELLAEGSSYDEISEKTGIPTLDVTNRISDLLEKFNVESEEELIKFSKEKHIIPNQFSKYLN